MMEEGFSLQEMLEVTGGRLINLSEDRKIFIFPSQICTDTRKIKKGDFFVALKGKNFDGNDFIAEAHRKGARGAIVSRAVFPLSNNFFLIQVKDTLKALQEIAKFYRQKFSIPVVAVTGSNGKTTVKELVSHILSGYLEVCRSEGNFNNQIGVPLSILKLTPRHRVLVLELGMNRAGEIETLSRIAQPTVGVITNIHPSHIGLLGGMTQIARAKAEIIPFLNRNQNNILILNEDDPWSQFFKKKATCNIFSFGIKNKADFMAKNISDEGGKVCFEVTCVFSEEKVEVESSLPGIFNVYNILAACAICSLMGVPLKEAKEAIKDFCPPPFHYQIEQAGKCLLLNDCYNANPGSMKFALCWLKKMRGKRKIAVLGDMLELGDFTASYHKDIGKLASSLKIDALFAVGKFSSHVVEGAKEGGLKEAFFFEEKDSLLAELVNYLKEDDCVLVKGSRQTRMEEIIKMLKVHLRE